MARTQRAFPANNIKIATGSYVGNATAGLAVNVGFRPQFVIIKRIGGVASTMFAHPDIPYGNGGFLHNAAESTGHLLNISNNGFILDSGTNINNNGSTHRYIAFGGKSEALATGTYKGSGADNRNFTDTQRINFTPGFSFIKCSTFAASSWRCSQHSGQDAAASFDTIAEAADKIQNLQANGFQLGTNSSVNTNTVLYRYFCMATTSEFYYDTSYVGNGTSQVVTLPFSPDFLFLKGNSATSFGALWWKEHPGTTFKVDAATDLTTGITGITVNPANSSQYLLSLGANSVVNENAVTFRLCAFKAGDFIVPFTRTLV